MPHAVMNQAPATTPQVNGEKVSASATISHIASYPLISDSLAHIRSTRLGAQTLNLSAQGYQALARPLLPYLSEPYRYISPYVTRADALCDTTLRRLDASLPVLQRPTHELLQGPARLSADVQAYLVRVYNAERRRFGGRAEDAQTGADGLLLRGKAAVSAGVVVSRDGIAWVRELVGAKKAAAKETINEKAGH